MGRVLGKVSVPHLPIFALLAVISVALRSDSAFYAHLDSLRAVMPFLYAMLAGAAAAMLAWVWWTRHLAPVGRRVEASVGLAASLLGAALAFFGPQALTVAALGGLLFGFGLAMSLLAWLQRYAELDGIGQLLNL